jgi:hypothetical protein
VVVGFVVVLVGDGGGLVATGFEAFAVGVVAAVSVLVAGDDGAGDA